MNQVEKTVEKEKNFFEYDKVFVGYNSKLDLIKSNVINECYKVANSQANFAVQLVHKCYSKTERATSDCAGIGKKPSHLDDYQLSRRPFIPFI